MRRLLRWFPLAWATGTYVLLLFLPVYGRASNTISSGGSATRTTERATIAAVNGPVILLIIAIPVLAAALAVLPLPTTLRRPADIAGAIIAAAFVLLGTASIGVFFVPSAVALIALAVGDRPTLRSTT